MTEVDKKALTAISWNLWASTLDFVTYSKTCLYGHSKRRPKLVLKTDYGLMQVKCIAECSKRAFCNTFDLH